MKWHVEVLTEPRLDDFANMCEELWAESKQQHLVIDHAVCLRLGTRYIHDPAFFCQLAVNEHNDVVGFMAGFVTPLFFSSMLIGNEEGLYVREGTPERAAIAAEMLRRFVRFCKDAGAADVRTGVISNIENYAVDVFYRRNGFKRIGMIYALRNSGEK